MNKIYCSAPGRICLFGDHMDWCGYQVITAAINKHIFLEGKLNGTSAIRVRSYPPFKPKEQFDLYSFKLEENSDFKYLRGVIKAYQESDALYRIKGMDFRFYENNVINEVKTSLPAGKGLSSSAAMSVVIAGVIDLLHRNTNIDSNGMKEFTISEEQIALYAKMAYISEREKLGINCGQMDPYVSAYGGFLFIDCKDPIKIEKIPSKSNMRLVIGDTNQPKDTPRILKWLGERYTNREPLILEGINEITQIVKKARKELFKKKPNLKIIGKLMNENQHYIANNLKISGNCPVSPSNLDQLITAANSAGSYGSKVTGSGGGGCMVALCSKNNCKEVSQAIRTAGGSVMISEIPETGFKIEK